MFFAAILLAFALAIAATVRYYLQLFRHDGPPTVWPTIPFVGDAYQYLYDPFNYLEKCRLAHGPIFRCLLGNRRMIVVCDTVGCQAILRDKNRVFSTYDVHRGVAGAIAKVGADVAHYLPDRLLPLTAELFSLTDLPHTLPALNRGIYRCIDDMEISADAVTPLSHFVGESLYRIVSMSVFGKAFPVSTFREFEMIDLNFANILTGIPLLAMSAKRGRDHMLAVIGEYIDTADPEALPEPATKVLNALADLHLSRQDRNGLFLLFIWGLHSTTIRASFWLFAYLLNSPDALRCLQEEIDRTLANEYPDINSLLDAPSSKFDGPGFTLLNSAVKEAIRASSFITPVREVCEDTVVTLSTGATYPLRKGESVTVNLPMIHNDPDAFHNPLEFKLDRFISKEDNKKGQHYLPWGGVQGKTISETYYADLDYIGAAFSRLDSRTKIGFSADHSIPHTEAQLHAMLADARE